MLKFADPHFAESLLKKIGSTKLVKYGKKISFAGSFDFLLWQYMVQELVVFPKTIPDLEKGWIIWHGLLEAAIKGKITPESFLEATESVTRKYHRRRPKRRVLITTISIPSSQKLPKVLFEDAHISFPQKIPNPFFINHQRIVDGANLLLSSEIPVNYRWVRVSISAKTLSGPRNPVNSITLGPIHTVHSTTGKIEKEFCWYNPNYNASISSREIKVDSEELYKFTRQTRNKLKKIQYRGRAENFIRLYNRALDENDWSTSFIRLWQVLEEITGTRKANYDVTIRCASFLYENPEYHRGMLNHLREIRNNYIHSGSETLTIESSLYLLKNYVEKIIMFHLRNAGFFRSIAEVAEILSLPAAKEELLKKERLIKIALKIRG